MSFLQKSLHRVIFPVLSTLFFWCAGCADRDHRVVISVPDQSMELYYKGALVAQYPVSTSKFGLGSEPGSNRTPVGNFVIKTKVGTDAVAGTVFKDRKRTGEVLAIDASGRDPIVTRILWLHGLEAGNRNTYGRYIYIHGTPEERNIGTPASYGCVRMRSEDVIAPCERVGPGARVVIADRPVAVLSTWGSTYP